MAAEARQSARERQKVETRTRLYDASLQLFREKGFDAVQVDEIVRLAGVARGTFYLHFQGKDEVLEAFRDSVESDLRARLEAIESAASVAELFERTINALLETREEPGVVRELVGLAFRSPATSEWDESPHVLAITPFVAQLQREGKVRGDLEPGIIAALFLAGVFGFLIGPAAPPRRRRAAIEQFARVFADGLRPDV